MKVLLVDDDTIIREDIKKNFDWKEAGFDHVFEASNGEEAWDIIQSESPELILTDISMPRMNGVELIKRLKQINFQGKCIVMSNYDDFDYVKDAMKYGAFDYCLKYKIRPDSLMKLITEAKESIFKNTSLIDETIYSQRANYYSSVINGSNDLAFDSVIDRAVRTIYIRHFPDDSEHLGMKPSIRPNEFIIHITNEEDVVIIEDEKDITDYRSNDTYSRALGYSRSFPEAIVVYGTSPIGISHLRNELERMKSNIGNYFYTGNRVMPYLRDYQCQKNITVNKKKAFQKELLSDCFEWKPEGLKNTLDNIFQYFYEKQIRPQTICLFFEDVLFEVGNILDPVQKVDFQVVIPDDRLVSFITSQQMKNMIYEQFVSFFHVATGIDQPDVIRGLYYINANYMNKLSLQQISDYIGISKNHFCMIFHRETGQNYVTYLQKLRIEKAKELLSTGKYRVNEVASLVGIDNSRYFCKLFQDYEGCTPSKYKVKDQ